MARFFCATFARSHDLVRHPGPPIRLVCADLKASPELVLLAGSQPFDASCGVGHGHRLRGLKARQHLELQLNGMTLFNQMPMGLGAWADKAQRIACLARATCSAYAVGVVNCRSWEIKVHHAW